MVRGSNKEAENTTLTVDECCEKIASKRVPVNPYRWVILLAAAMTMFTTGSLTYAAGVIHVALLETYPEISPSYLVWVGSAFMFIFGPIGPVGSFIISTFSCRVCVVTSGILALFGFSSNFLVSDPKWLMLTYGLLAGSSIGLAVMGSVVIISYYFTDQVAIATGVFLCGQALGIFIHPPLMQYIVDTFGLRGAFMLMGGFAFHTCIFGMLMRPSKFEKSRKRQFTENGNRLKDALWSLRTSCSSYGTLLRNRSYVYLMFACLAIGMAFAIEYLYIPDYFHKGGVSKQMSSFAMSISGIGSCLSRLLIGVLANDKSIEKGLTYSCLAGLTGVLTFFIHAFRGSSEKALVYGFLLGLYTGGTQSLTAALIVDTVGVELAAPGTGMIILANGIGYLIGPPLSNAVFGLTGNYSHAFACAALMFLTTSVLGFLSTLSQKRADEAAKGVSPSQKTESEDMDNQLSVTLINSDC